MPDPTNKGELVEHIRSGRAAWEALLAQVPPDRWTEPGVAGDWTLKDVLAHVAFYEWRAVYRLQAVARGAAPTPHPVIAGLDDDAANAWIYEQNRARPLAEVQVDEQQAYEQLLVALAPVGDDALFRADHFPWMQGSALWETLPGNVYAHYEEHMPPLQAWLAATPA